MMTNKIVPPTSLNAQKLGLLLNSAGLAVEALERAHDEGYLTDEAYNVLANAVSEFVHGVVELQDPHASIELFNQFISLVSIYSNNVEQLQNDTAHLLKQAKQVNFWFDHLQKEQPKISINYYNNNRGPASFNNNTNATQTNTPQADNNNNHPTTVHCPS